MQQGTYVHYITVDVNISVSTNGSRGMQRCIVPLICAPCLISVSTNGSRGMQLKLHKMAVENASKISVSTNGSRGMQRVGHPHRVCRSRISVSTNGSRGMQHPRRRPHHRHNCGFQYPLTDRGGCNIWKFYYIFSIMFYFSIH